MSQKSPLMKTPQYVPGVLTSDTRSYLTISIVRIYVFGSFTDKEFVERYLDGLRQAGLPE
jgi:hypothetical protein